MIYEALFAFGLAAAVQVLLVIGVADRVTAKLGRSAKPQTKVVGVPAGRTA